MVPPSFVDHGPKLRLLKVTKSGPEAKKRPTERPNGRLPENRSYPSGYGGLTIPLSWFFGRKSIFCSHPPISLLPLWLNTKTTTFSCCSCCWASTRGGVQEPKRSDFYDFHCIAWHRRVLHGIALYVMVSHSFHVLSYGIAWYCIVSYGIALLASARGLYLARHLYLLYL